MTTPLKISVIIGSTRPERFSEKPAQWIFDMLKQQSGVEAELLDLRDYPLPFYNEAKSPCMLQQPYPNPAVQKWAEKIAEADGFIIVSPEYNHSTSGVLKNALDSVYHEWNNKAVGFVGYGSVGGARAVEHLRGVAAELQMASVRQAVHIQWGNYMEIKEGKPDAFAPVEKNAQTMIGQLISWTKALKTARNPA